MIKNQNPTPPFETGKRNKGDEKQGTGKESSGGERKRRIITLIEFLLVGILIFKIWKQCDLNVCNRYEKEEKIKDSVAIEEEGSPIIPITKESEKQNTKSPKKAKEKKEVRTLSSSEREELDEILNDLREAFAPNPNSESKESMFETCLNGGEFEFIKFIDGQLRRAESIDPHNEKVIFYRRKYNALIK